MGKQKLKFTKFFDVESPEGNGDGPYANAGVDLYMPRQSSEFLEAFMKMNKAEICQTIIANENMISYSLIRAGKILAKFDKKTGLSILDDVCIPLGIGICIPEGYHLDLRSKSSNFKNKYTSVHGLIDCGYTYGMAVQIIPLDNKCCIQVDQKITQITMIANETIVSMEEVKLKDWENSELIHERREKRVGGFGSTGLTK